MPKAIKKNHFKKWKQNEVKELNEFVKEYPILAIADISNLPAGANREFREILKNKGFKVRVSKIRLINKVLKETKLDELKKFAEGQVALIGGDENPFAMYSEIKRNASTTAAKVGSTAPDDIVVPEGKTNIPPGPALSDFKAVKINTQIKDGFIYVPKDYTVAKKGDIIDAKVVSILGKLGIKPIKVLLNVRSAYDKNDKILYPVDVLDIDLDKVKNDIIGAYQNSYFLALGRGIVNKDTIKPLVVKAYNNSKSLAMSQDIVTKDTISGILGKANKIAEHLSNKVNN